MKIAYLADFRTGYELTENDIHRIKERIGDSLDGLAKEYLAELQVEISHIVPGPFPPHPLRVEEKS